MSKYEADLRSLSPRLTGDTRLVLLLRARRWNEAERLLAGELEPLAVDFLQVYEEEDNSWRLRAQVADTAVPSPGAFSDELVRRAVESNDAMRSEAGYVALPVRIPDAAGAAGARRTSVDAGSAQTATAGEKSDGVVLVIGYWLGEDFFANVSEVTDGLVHYGQLEIYRRVEKEYVWVTAAILFAVAAIVSLITAAFLARQLSKPILGLTEGMKRVAAGDLDEKVVVKAGGEIGYLVDSFNQMTRDLRAYKEQLARAERIAAWQDVARYAAHEIRNPLTPIKLSLHRLHTCLEQLNEENRRRFSDSLDSILGEVSSLERLATAFSDFAKLPDPVFAPIDVNGIISEVAELYRSTQEGTSFLRIDLSLDASLPAVPADAQQIRMAVLNVVKNAAEAMPEGGTLWISSKRANESEVNSNSCASPNGGASSNAGAKEYIEIAFRDTGPGIPETIIGKVMTPHFTTKKGGTGLGLAVVSKIVSQHGGKVFIQSQETRGTLVRIVLPAQRKIPRLSSA